MVYQWKTASRIKADANEAGALFEHLEQTVGLTPKTVLDASRAAGTPLHEEFEWDDAAAAEQYRLHQAGHLIRCICTVTETDDGKKSPVRAFFKTTGTDGYEAISVILKNENKLNSLLARALQELESFERKYQQLAELSPVFEAAKAVRRGVSA